VEEYGELNLRELYDPEGSNRSTGIINGKQSNVLNWDDVRYDWAYPMYKQMLGNFWTPFEVNMTKDSRQYMELTDIERNTFNMIIGNLTSLDSIQTDFAGRVTDYITDSSVNAILIILAQQEVVHNHSYSYVLSSCTTKEEQDKVFALWKTDPVLNKRNDFIFNIYKEFAQEKSPKTIVRALIADIILEGLFFYSGFAFFYDLSRSGRMVATATMINYINRDEHVHVGLFRNIFKSIIEENDVGDLDELRAYGTEAFRQAAELEIEWGNYIIGTKFETIDMHELAGYVKHMANLRAKQMGFEKPFPSQETNPLKWIKVYEDVDMGKTDFFEQKVRNYTKVDDEFDDL
jgi:ribonucleoside-diphosphate reductase beta chain